jgi:uncharacterized protein
MAKQDIINSFEFAKKSLEIHGKILISQLPRLHDALRSQDGELEYHLRGGAEVQGAPSLMLHVRGVVTLSCQRCLGELRLPLDLQAHFVVVPSEAALPSPEDERDDIDYLVADAEMQVWQLVEDEVLLGLPLAPVHMDDSCTGDSIPGTEKMKENPFKVLQGFKLQKD